MSLSWIAALTGRIGFRLALLLALALLPLVIISVLNSNAIRREAQNRTEEALQGETVRAAATELRMIQRAQSVAEDLAAIVPSIVGDPEICTAIMKRVVADSGIFSFVGFYDRLGQINCSSTGKAYDFSETPAIMRSLTNPHPEVNVNRDAPISRTSIIYALQPVYDAQGSLIGGITVSVPHRKLTSGKEPARIEGLALLTFDEEGEILTSSIGMDPAASVIPAERPLITFVGSQSMTFTSTSVGGEERTFSVIPLIDGSLYALGSLALKSDRPVERITAISPALFPVLMALASLVVAWLGSTRLVTRHIRDMRRSIVAFEGGNRMVENVEYQGAPTEIRQIGAAFSSMMQSILRDEAQLEDTVHQKEVLLREVHHRVKNNLQLIASIMNMQMRKAQSQEAKVLMRGLQDRVMSLATIHRGLYQTSGLADVKVSELLSDIVRQIITMSTGPERQFKVDTGFDDLRMTPDQAVPLALLVTESLTNAMKYAGGPGDTVPSLSITLRQYKPGVARLRIVNSVSAEAVAEQNALQSTGLGSQLIQAFAQQIGGTVTRHEDGGTYDLTVEFSLRALAEAENRHTIPPH